MSITYNEIHIEPWNGGYKMSYGPGHGFTWLCDKDQLKSMVHVVIDQRLADVRPIHRTKKESI